MSDPEGTPSSVRWARLRFLIVGPLLGSPPEHGDLQARIRELADRKWKHPSTGEMIAFDFKTIEKWYYIALATDDPVAALARKVPKHAGTHPSISPLVGATLRRQHVDHVRWTYQLHYDELRAVAREHP